MVFAFLIPSTPEIIIVLIVALLVFGPQKLPEIGKQVGSALRELNKMRGDFQNALNIDELTRDHSADHNSVSRYDSHPYGTLPETIYPAMSHDNAPLLESPDPSHTHGSEGYTPSLWDEQDSPASSEDAVAAAVNPIVSPPNSYLPHTVSVSAGSSNGGAAAVALNQNSPHETNDNAVSGEIPFPTAGIVSRRNA